MKTTTELTPKEKWIKRRSTKSRPKLKPISPDKVEEFHNLDDYGGGGDELGFGEILTIASSISSSDAIVTTKEEQTQTTTKTPATTPTPSSPSQSLARMITPRRIEDTNRRKKEVKMKRQNYYENKRIVEKKDESNDGVEQRLGVAPAAYPTLSYMAQHSSITSPSAGDIETTLYLKSDFSTDSDADEGVSAPFKFAQDCENDRGNDEIIGEDTNTEAVDQVRSGEEYLPAGATPPLPEGKRRCNKRDTNGNTFTEDENLAIVDRIPTISSVASSDSSSSDSSSSSSSDGTQSADENKNQNPSRVIRYRQLQSEIRSRQKLLAKLLRGREGTAYARMFRRQEDTVNARLLESVRIKDTSEIPATNDSGSNAGLFQTIQFIFLDEYYHTLPAAISLILHCSLYVTIYAGISNCVSWMCDTVINYLTRWHITEHNFDATYHEHVFYFCVLVLALAVTRLTGVIYDWNGAWLYQKRKDFYFRNKWYLGCWDGRLINYFSGDELRKEYERENSVSETYSKRKRVWGPRLKYILDLFSFFVCYKCMDHFVYKLGASPMSDITESVLVGLPSRKLHEQHDQHLTQARSSHACSNVMSALENPYVEDMMNWIASADFQSEEANNWITNAKKCGWSGSASEADDDAVVESGDDNAGNAKENDGTGTSLVFITRQRTMNAHDDKYLRHTISNEAYWELLDEATPTYSDPAREYLFLFVSTTVCIGLLYCVGVPFLLV